MINEDIKTKAIAHIHAAMKELSKEIQSFADWGLLSDATRLNMIHDKLADVTSELTYFDR